MEKCKTLDKHPCWLRRGDADILEKYDILASKYQEIAI
jgi:hypothetical protein